MGSKWTAAFALLGVLVVFGAAGSAALSASYDQTTTIRNDSAAYSDPSPPAVDAGKTVTNSLASLLPLLAWVAVPLGILGILTIGGTVLRGGGRGTGRMHR